MILLYRVFAVKSSFAGDKKRLDSKEAVKIIFEAAVRAVNPYSCVVSHLDGIRETCERSGFEKLYIAAFGKAAYAMCRAAEEKLGGGITEGVAITKYGHGGSLRKIKIFEASHPIPDKSGVEASREVVDLLESADEKTLVLCLVSGGGSALLASPCEGITLEDKRKTTDLLLKSGAEINELNAVRKHISSVKGGRLAEIASPAPVISLILSDVIGDSLDVIASGPTAPDSSTFKDALQIIERYKLKDHTPPSVVNLLTAGSIGMIGETPKPDSEIFTRVKNSIIGNNKIALKAAEQKAEDLGFAAEIKSAEVAGEARDVAKEMAVFALNKKNKISPGKPLCYISGGETTVSVKGSGMGGRNMELALAFAQAIKGVEGITLLSAGTDGTDGPTDAAGAIVDGMTVPQSEVAGLNAGTYLENNDSYNFFKRAGGLLMTGPTGTNVMDVQIMIVE